MQIHNQLSRCHHPSFCRSAHDYVEYLYFWMILDAVIRRSQELASTNWSIVKIRMIAVVVDGMQLHATFCPLLIC